MPTGTLNDTAVLLGFQFSRTGCPCNGLNHIYRKGDGRDAYQLTCWPKRDVWQLKQRGCLLASGNANNMQSKIKALWDL